MNTEIEIEPVTPDPEAPKPRQRNDAAIGLLVILGIALLLFGILVWSKSQTAPAPVAATKIETEKPTETSAVTEPELILPRFEVVRVETDGNALLAGNSDISSKVLLLVDGTPFAETTSDAAGSFAFLTELPAGEQPLEISLSDADGNSTGEVVLIQPRDPAVTEPKIVTITQDGQVEARPLSPAPKNPDLPPEITPLSLDTINYTDGGNVVLGGRLTDGQDLRIYVDNEPAQLTRADDGQWSVELADIDEGIYTLRVDALAEDGSVAERVESPFKRVYPTELGPDVTIQPGYTLWKLAEIKYGSGDMYLQIVNANRDIIKDPDLIYPGQLFELPEDQ